VANVQTQRPRDEVAERAILSACLRWPIAYEDAAARLTGAEFYSGKHAAVWAAMAALRAAKKPIDEVTVVGYLEAKGQLEHLGGAAWVAELTHDMAVPDNVHVYAQRVVDLATKRRVMDVAEAIEKLGGEPGLSVEETVARAESALATAVGRPVFRRATGADMARELLEAITKAAQGEGPVGYPTGFAGLDRVTHGLQPGEFSAIGARSSMGKTTFALALVAHLLDQGVKVGIVSLEMPRLQLARNIAAARAGIDGQRVRSGQLTHEERSRLADVVEWLERVPLLVDDSPPGPGPIVVSRVRSLVARDRCKVVVLDYLQLVQIQDHRAGEAELSAVSQQLKQITREFPDAHVIAVCQLNRDVEKRRDHEPMLSDLRGSGQLEQDLDLVLMLMRPHYYDRSKDPRLCEVHVLKQRNGPTDMVELAFRRELLRFEEPPPEGFVREEPPTTRRRRFVSKNGAAKAGEEQ
jgi:replicative DNA helicase